MKIIKGLPLGVAPVLLMSYGWVLGQLHQSGYDIAGILLFISGTLGLALAVTVFLLTQKYPWHGKWAMNVLIRLGCCGIAFALMLVLAKIHV